MTDENTPDDIGKAALQQLADAAENFQPLEDADREPMRHDRWTFEQKQLAPYPPVFSYVGSPILSPARFQGNWYACTSFAIVAALESRFKKANGADVRLIPGFIHNCLVGRDDPNLGVEIRGAAELCRQYGILIGNNDSLPVPNAVCTNNGDRLHFQAARLLPTRDAVYHAVYFSGPVVVDMWASPEFFYHQGDGIFQSPPRPQNAVRHTIAIVGYETGNGHDVVHVQHSGGANWGVGGCGRIALGSGGLLADQQPLELLF